MSSYSEFPLGFNTAALSVASVLICMVRLETYVGSTHSAVPEQSKG